jgi:hypothetical protein
MEEIASLKSDISSVIEQKKVSVSISLEINALDN